MTTALVIAEAGWLLERQLGPDAEASLYGAVAVGEIQVESLDAADWVCVSELVAAYSDLGLGGVDASLVTIAERLGQTVIATLDHRDFRVVRPNHCDGFELIPAAIR